MVIKFERLLNILSYYIIPFYCSVSFNTFTFNLARRSSFCETNNQNCDKIMTMTMTMILLDIVDRGLHRYMHRQKQLKHRKVK